MKSRHRVKTYGEVFTPRHMVDRMLDLVREELETGPDFVDKTFLEPAAGRRQLPGRDPAPQAPSDREAVPARGVARGVPVRPRLDLRHRAAGGQPPGRQGGHARRVPALPRRATVSPVARDTNLRRAAAFLIDTNIVRGDTLTGLDWRGEEIQFSWWNRIDGASRHGSARAVHARLAARRQRFDFTVYDSYAVVPDRPGPRGSEGRCLARRSARSVRSSRSSTRGGRPDIPKYDGLGEDRLHRAGERRHAHRPAGAPDVHHEGEGLVAAGPVHVRGRRALHGQGLPRLPASSRAWSARPRPSGPSGTTSPIAPKTSLEYFNDFAGQDFTDLQRGGDEDDYVLRPEQQAAVDQAVAAFEAGQGRGALERQAPVRQDADDVRPDADPGRPAGPDRHQPPGDRELLVRRLHALHRPPDHLPVRLGVALAGRALAR